jgi:predicted alpha/beta-hydrolase family hydrolase
MPAGVPAAVSVIAHGAGAGMTHPFMTGAAEGLAEGGVSVLRFNFPYLDARRRVPDPPAVLLRTWAAALRRARELGEALPLIAGGKSLGGRMASMLAAEEGSAFPAAALVFFGYPLHPPGRPERLRDAHLAEVRTPMLFIQGTRDALARFDLLEALVARLGTLARLHVVAGADHSFRVPGVKRPDREIGRELGRIAADYARALVGDAMPPRIADA